MTLPLIVRTNLRGPSSVWPPLFPINRLLPCSVWPKLCWITSWVIVIFTLPGRASCVSDAPRDVLSLCSIHFLVPSRISGLQDDILPPAPKFPHALSAHSYVWLSPILLFTCFWVCHYLWILLNFIMSNQLLYDIIPWTPFAWLPSHCFQDSGETPWTNNVLFPI